MWKESGKFPKGKKEFVPCYFDIFSVRICAEGPTRMKSYEQRVAFLFFGLASVWKCNEEDSVI